MVQKMKEKKGFTLAELLVVVAIIGVLVAVSIPIFTSQLERSRDAVSIANIRAAYAEATTSLLTWDGKTTGAITGTNVKSITKDTSSKKTTVIVEKVAIKSTSDDNWSGLAAELPATTTKPTDPGKAGMAEVTFVYDASGACESISVGTPA